MLKFEISLQGIGSESIITAKESGTTTIYPIVFMGNCQVVALLYNVFYIKL